MSSLFAALRSSADALGVFERSLTVSQNNVANASTPGYVRQTQSLQALSFDPSHGVVGGVSAGKVDSARDEYAETAVQREVTSLGRWEQQVDSLSSLQTQFDITGSGGVSGALTKLYQSFSAWSVSPNDGTARQQVLTQAQGVVDAFHQTSNALGQASADADTQLGGLVDQVNALAGKLRDYNVARRGGDNQDAGLDASIHSTLEQLSEIANITSLKQPDGSVTVLLGGQTALVVGEHQYNIALDVSVPQTPPPVNPSAPPSASILDSSGNNVTSQITGGRLSGLLQVRNGVLASIRGDAQQTGSLNQLAASFADRVNSLLTTGQIDNQQPTPTPGVPMFTYDATNATTTAQTLSVDPNITPAQLAAIDPGPPYVANGTALKLAGLTTPATAADGINGQSYTAFYGNIAAMVGSAVSTATNNQSLAQDLTTQARDLRQQSSGVSLDEEAVRVLQFQRSYQAAAKMVNVLDSLTQTVVNLIGTT